jgi:sec-independent protein translocase protein TatC
MSNVDMTAQSTEPTMSLLDHVRELRDRLFRVVIALVIGASLGYYFRNELIALLKTPYPGELVTRGVPDQLTTSATLAITVGAVVTLPVILSQIFGFIAPGLYPHEKRWLYWTVPFGILLFFSGAAFAYFFMLPTMIPFLIGILNPELIKAQLDFSDYYTFVSGVLFWMGVAFEMPVIMFALAKFNVISARALRMYWRYAIVGMAIIAAFITPTPDPVNMGIVMVPLMVLYGLSIVLAKLARRGATTPAMLDPNEFDDKTVAGP